jgi:peptide/nickel transport system substrate-binding protein
MSRTSSRGGWLAVRQGALGVCCVALCGAAILITTAVANAKPAANAKLSSSVLTVNMNPPQTIDPSEAATQEALGIINSAYVRLMQYGTEPGPKGTLEVDSSEVLPYLARSVKISDGNKRYTFRLNHATFNDGTPITSAAVKYSLDRDLKMGGAGLYVTTDVDPTLITSINTPSKYTVVLNLRQPNADMLTDLAQGQAAIVEPKVVEAHGGVVSGKINPWVSTHVAGGGGPFVLESFNAGTGAVLKRNPHYFSTPAKSAEIKVGFITSDLNLELQARSGAADITLDLSPEAAKTLESDKGVKVILNQTDQVQRMTMIDSLAPFNNHLVREALTYAVPYQQILQVADEASER